MSDYTMQIGGRTVGGKEPTFVIAEIGPNRNGSQERALEMVDMARNGCPLRQVEPPHQGGLSQKKPWRKGDDLSTEYTLDLLDKFSCL